MSFDYFSIRRMQYFLEKIKNVLGSAAYKNVPTAGDAGVTQVVLGNDSRLTDARTPVAHNQASNTINAMTGYSKPNATSAIAVSDTLNDAVGKLEKGLDSKTNTWTGTQAEYAAQAAGIPDGTIIDITDDEEAVPQITVVDNLTTQDATKALSANQGYVLKGLIDSKSDILVLHLSEDENTGDTVCDKTPSEVLAAYQAGKAIFLLDTKYDYLYLFESYSDYDDYYIISFSKCEARYSGLIDVKTYNLTSSEDTDTWDDIDYDDTNLEFAHVEISLSNGSYICDASPTEMSLALQYRDSLGVFLQYTEDDTVYNVSYADFTNNIYHFSTVIKDNSNNFKLRTFVLTASGSSWGSITMNEVAIGGSSGSELQAIELTTTEYNNLPMSDKKNPLKLYFTTKGSVAKDWDGGYEQINVSDIWTDGTNTYYSWGSRQYKLNGINWEPMTWTGLTNFDGEYIWSDGTNIYYSYEENQYKLNGTTWESMTWTGLTSFRGDYIFAKGSDVYYIANTSYKLNGTTWETITWTSTYYPSDASSLWTDGTNIYDSSNSFQYKLNGTAWESMTWTGLTSFSGDNIWTDGTEIYYSSYFSHYKLNGTTWESVTWTGLDSFSGDNIWTDGTDICYYSTHKLNGTTWERIYRCGDSPSFSGEYVWSDGTNIYYSYEENQYKLNGNLWEHVNWSGLTSFDGKYIWTDNTNIYYSSGTDHYKLNGTTWESMTWSGLTNFNGIYIWTDGTNIYFSSGSNQYKLNGTTWESMTWTGLTSFSGANIWTDGEDIYYSYNSNQYKLNGTTWESMSWTGLTSFNRKYIWTDGSDIYYSYGSSNQYKLNGTTWESMTWQGYTGMQGEDVWTDGNNIYYSAGWIQYRLDGTTWSAPPYIDQSNEGTLYYKDRTYTGQGGSGGSSPSHLIIISSAGSTVEVETPSGETITATQTTGSTTQWECDTTEFGKHTITITLSSTDYTHDIDINCTESIKVIYIAIDNDWIDIRSNSGKPELTMEQYNYLVENDLDEPDVDYHIKDASPVSAKNLDDLLDVQITSPSNGQTLTYESSSSKWKNKTPAFAGLWTTAVSGSVGDTTITFTDSNITTTSILDLYSENESGTPVSYTSVEISAGEAEYTIPALEEATDFKLWIRNL